MASVQSVVLIRSAFPINPNLAWRFFMFGSADDAEDVEIELSSVSSPNMKALSVGSEDPGRVVLLEAEAETELPELDLWGPGVLVETGTPVKLALEFVSELGVKPEVEPCTKLLSDSVRVMLVSDLLVDREADGVRDSDTELLEPVSPVDIELLL